MPISQSRMLAVIMPARKAIEGISILTELALGLEADISSGQVSYEQAFRILHETLMRARLAPEVMAPIYFEIAHFTPEKVRYNEKKRALLERSRLLGPLPSPQSPGVPPELSPTLSPEASPKPTPAPTLQDAIEFQQHIDSLQDKLIPKGELFSEPGPVSGPE